MPAQEEEEAAGPLAKAAPAAQREAAARAAPSSSWGPAGSPGRARPVLPVRAFRCPAAAAIPRAMGKAAPRLSRCTAALREAATPGAPWTRRSRPEAWAVVTCR